MKKNISANLLSNLWSTALSLLLTPLYVKYLGVENFGLIGFHLSWLAIVGIVDTGISAAAVREIAWLAARPNEKWKIPNLLLSLEFVYWGIILIFGVVLFIWSWFFGAGWFQTKFLAPEVVRDALLLMAVSVVAQVPSGLYVGGLMGLQRQVECSGLLALFRSLRGVGAILVLRFICPDVRAFFLWQIIVSVMQTGMLRRALWKKVGVEGQHPVFSINDLRLIKGFTVGMILITALSLIITQADRMLLSRAVALDVFGYYMLAWTVASGLSRVATPLMQAFGPHFTELISRGADEELAKKVHIASQLMNALILPPAALIAFSAKPVLYAWMGNRAVAEGAGPILAILVTGTALLACSYPSLSILYSKKEIGSVIVVNLVCLVLLLPALVWGIVHFGLVGAASISCLYGLIQFVAYQAYGLRGIPGAGLFSALARDFTPPCMASFAVAAIASRWLNQANGKMIFIAQMGLVLIVGWSLALLVCKDIVDIVSKNMKLKAELDFSRHV